MRLGEPPTHTPWASHGSQPSLLPVPPWLQTQPLTSHDPVGQAEGKLCSPEPQFQSRASPPPGVRRCQADCKPHSDAARQPAASPSSEVTGPACHQAAKAQCPPQSGQRPARCQDGRAHPHCCSVLGATTRTCHNVLSKCSPPPQAPSGLGHIPGTRQRNPASKEISTGWAGRRR